MMFSDFLTANFRTTYIRCIREDKMKVKQKGVQILVLSLCKYAAVEVTLRVTYIDDAAATILLSSASLS